MKIIVINGPNLNLIKRRNSNAYGENDLTEIRSQLEKEFPSISIDFFQTNSEDEIVRLVQSAPDSHDALIINPAGYSHTSVAIRDALEICDIPKIEVHLSNIASREDFRQYSLTSSVCDGYISGFKQRSYIAAVYILSHLLQKKF
ncbi:MAG TPA: type II 3-dehydroquinate dehydratase [Melioribacteraceae bacterium]|nr:type II 3-dehydroquinate dehydratase [Melioribacteraceae bacterium]